MEETSEWPVKIGAHQSISGGLEKAFDRIRKVGGEALQIFTRNQRQWNAPPLKPEEVKKFREEWSRSSLMPVASHASYLINPGSSDELKRQRSLGALVAELDRCGQLGIPFVVLHPGSHGGDGEHVGLVNTAAMLDSAFELTADSEVMILLETTAGQGTGLGSRFEELAWLMANSAYTKRLGICVDTCHIFAAGYDIRSSSTYRKTLDALDGVIGLEHVRFIHLNDSKKGCGSRVDRHEHIGKGQIGLDGFRLLLNDSRVQHIPMTLETPKGDDLREDRENLQRLRKMFRKD